MVVNFAGKQFHRTRKPNTSITYIMCMCQAAYRKCSWEVSWDFPKCREGPARRIWGPVRFFDRRITS